MQEGNLKKFQCNDCLNSRHGCIKKINGQNPCPGGILKTDLIQTDEGGQKVPLRLVDKCKGRIKIPWYQKTKTKLQEQKRWRKKVKKSRYYFVSAFLFYLFFNFYSMKD